MMDKQRIHNGIVALHRRRFERIGLKKPGIDSPSRCMSACSLDRAIADVASLE